MTNKPIDHKMNIIKQYLNSELSLRKVAGIYGINYRTLFKWVKNYREKGVEAFISERKHPLKLKPDIVQKIIKLKERFPEISLRKAKELLAQSGIKVSLGALWKVWRNGGYAGYKRTSLSNDFKDYIVCSKNDLGILKIANLMLNDGDIIKAAEILNRANILSENEILMKIPEKHLNIKRRLEKIVALFGKIRITEFINLAKSLFEECVLQKYYYSALRTGTAILIAYSWMGEAKELFRWKNKLEKILNRRFSKHHSYLLLPYCFSLLIAEGFACIHNNQIKRAIEIANTANRKIAHLKVPPPYFMSDLAILYLSLERYNKAEHLMLKAIPLVDENSAARFKAYLAGYVYFPRGEFKKAVDLLKSAKMYDWIRSARWFRYRANYYLVKGSLETAMNMYKKALEHSQKTELPEEIVHSYIGLACSYAALGNREKCLSVIRRLDIFINKKRLDRFKILTQILLNKKIKESEILLLPSVKTIYLLHNKGYNYAYRYAIKKGIKFQFFRYLLFFPEYIKMMVKKGKTLNLPRNFLKLPVFNSEYAVIKIEFLGRPRIFRNKVQLKETIEPKKQSLLTYLALHIPEPHRSISLDRIYENFWPKSKSASRNLSFLLVMIRNLLKIPAHFLEIHHRGSLPVLTNNGIYFTTDYQEFEQTLARAKALQRAGEWEFAKKEFLQAFKLFRGEPFKKNFDDWSVNMRFRILSELENEAINFVRGCLEHNDGRNAKKVLEKVLKIIPDSEEIKKMMQDA